MLESLRPLRDADAVLDAYTRILMASRDKLPNAIEHCQPIGEALHHRPRKGSADGGRGVGLTAPTARG